MHHSYFTRVGNCNLSKTDRQTNNTICIGFGTPDKSNVDRLQLNAEWSLYLTELREYSVIYDQLTYKVLP